MKKQLVLVLGILAILFVVNLSCINTSKAATLYVGSEKQYTSIKSAISAANEGDIIIVSGGTYYESVTINKKIVLKGVDYPTISGGRWTVITITANDCTITGFNLTDGGSHPNWPAAGIWIKSNGNRIEDNIIHDNREGICLSDANNNIIISNHIYSNENDGITLGDSSSSGSHYNNISKNNISSNGEYGIGMWQSSFNNISMNTISKNGFESYYGGSGIYLSSYYNNIYLNNFENNYRDVYCFGSTNHWNSSDKLSYDYNSKTYTNYLGNYWKRYMGSDADNDGIGDSPYAISGVTIQDHFPLMYPYDTDKYHLSIDADEPQLNPGDSDSFTLPEDPFNYKGEYVLDEEKVRSEELAALPTVIIYANEYDISPALIMALIRQESSFIADSNGDNYIGYMQVSWDATIHPSLEDMLNDQYTGTNSEWLNEGKESALNIKYGTRYLKILNIIFEKGKYLYGSVSAIKVSDVQERLKFVLAAYNGGQGRIAGAQQLALEDGKDPTKWDDVKEFLEASGANGEKANEIRNYVLQVIKGRDKIEGSERGYEFFLSIRIFPLKDNEGTPGFELILIVCAVALVLFWKRKRKL
jgi:parallel beta-helix repeat protein